tara:strand:- start:1648 stop:2505 length:858 start_codon:yes stop_codon:yes gene_type:complete
MANTYFCISAPSHCYSDFLFYYLNKATHQNVATANASDAHYKDIADDLTKTVVASPYKHYKNLYEGDIPAATVNGWANSDAVKTALDAKMMYIGIPDCMGSTDNSIDADKMLEELVTKLFFQVKTDAGDSIWGAPWGATVDTASYDKLKVNSDVKFIFVDFADTSSTHFDKFWSRVEAQHSSDSSWQSNKATYKAYTKSIMGCNSYTTEDLQSNGSTTSVTVKNYALGYPTHNADGTKNDNVMVLQIDKLLDKDASTKAELATFLGVNTVDLSDSVIDTFLSDIA